MGGAVGDVGVDGGGIVGGSGAGGDAAVDGGVGDGDVVDGGAEAGEGEGLSACGGGGGGECGRGQEDGVRPLRPSAGHVFKMHVFSAVPPVNTPLYTPAPTGAQI